MACFEKSIVVWSEGQEKARPTKEDKEDASGEGEQECWFRGGRLELSEMELERLLLVWVNPATPIYRDKPRSKTGLVDCLNKRFFQIFLKIKKFSAYYRTFKDHKIIQIQSLSKVWKFFPQFHDFPGFSRTVKTLYNKLHILIENTQQNSKWKIYRYQK